MSSGPKYQYRHINDPSQIRLVSIIPRQNRKRIQLKLEHVSINEVEGQYEAVSYQWGSHLTEYHVVINDKTLRVRENIWRCLKHLRNHELTRSRLWIDSICINQSDEQEKSKQVAKMAQIFQSASRVLIWLGATSLQTYLGTPGLDSLEDNIADLPPGDMDAWIDVLGHSDSRSRSLENQIMSIVYNPYWERVWICQETALAEDPCIVFGKALLNRNCFFAMYYAARENSRPGHRLWITRQRDPDMISSTAILDHHPILRAGGHKRTMQDFSATNLGELIEYSHHKCCTDPRDYVFGIVSLLDPCQPFEIDYASSSEEVAVRALLYLAEEGTRKVPHQLGLNLSAACALLKALSVTSVSYLDFEQKLSREKAEAMQMKRLHLFFKPISILTPHDDIVQSEDTPYEDIIQLNVSGSLQKNLYVMKNQTPFQVKMLNGRIKQFSCAQDSTQQEKKSSVVLLCHLGVEQVVIVRWNPRDDYATRIEHFIRHDTTRQVHESPLSLEVQLPLDVQDALQREISVCRIDSNDLHSKSLLELSIRECISICELFS